MTWTAATVALARPACATSTCATRATASRFLRDGSGTASTAASRTSVLLDGTPDPAGAAAKMIYGQAFAVYALAAAHRATGDARRARARASGPTSWVEAHCRDEGRPGYRSGVRADGTPLPVDPDSVRPANERRWARPPATAT